LTTYIIHSSDSGRLWALLLGIFSVSFCRLHHYAIRFLSLYSLKITDTFKNETIM